jgi:hypothetical protein
MGDFVTRLAERAMGRIPVIRPLLPSVFAPEPDEYRLEPAPDHEPPPEREDRGPHSQPAETPTVPQTPTLVPDMTPKYRPDAGLPPPEVPEGPPTSPPNPPRPRKPTASRHVPASGPEPPDDAGRTRDAKEPGPPESRMESTRDARRYPSPTDPVTVPSKTGPAPSSSGRLVPRESKDRSSTTTIAYVRRSSTEPRFEKIQRVEPAPVVRGAYDTPEEPVLRDSPPDVSATKGGVKRSMPGTPKAAKESDPIEVAAPAPHPEASPGAAEDTLPSQITPTIAAPPIVPSIVRYRREERQESGPGEQRVPTAEPSAPTIKVAIGRIEVRAVTPSAPPVRQEAPSRPGPPLSLDDYLEQRGGGRT